MPEYLRAYVIVMALSGIAFVALNKLRPLPISKKEYRTWSWLWLCVTSIAFLAHNYWAFLLLETIIFWIFFPKPVEDRIATYIFLLPALPVLLNYLSGFGLVNLLLEMTYPRLLSIVILIPALFALKRPPGMSRKFPSDKFAFAYFTINALLSFRDTSFTGGLRGTVYVFLDEFLPYYVISRGITSLEHFRKAFSALLASAFVLAVVGVFEFGKQWLVYENVYRPLGARHLDFSGYISRRFGSIRISAVFAHSIVFGYFLVIAFAALNFLKKNFRARSHLLLFGAVMGISLLATFSRGPWVGFIMFVSVYAVFSPKRSSAVPLLIISIAVVMFMLIIIPGGEKILAFLPFIGQKDTTGNVSYREILFSAATAVIQKYPLFGSTTYLSEPELEALRQGQGIIDIVNTYLQIALDAGLIGVGLFLGVFFSILIGIRRAMKKVKRREEEIYRLGQTLLAIIVSVLLMIATASKIDFVPYYYWLLAGLGAGYAQMVNSMELRRAQNATRTNSQIDSERKILSKNKI